MASADAGSIVSRSPLPPVVFYFLRLLRFLASSWRAIFTSCSKMRTPLDACRNWTWLVVSPMIVCVLLRSNVFFSLNSNLGTSAFSFYFFLPPGVLLYSKLSSSSDSLEAARSFAFYISFAKFFIFLLKAFFMRVLRDLTWASMKTCDLSLMAGAV